MGDDKYADDTLRKRMKENLAWQDEIADNIRHLDSEEEDTMQLLQKDRRATELLYSGWTGEEAEKYISQSLEENRTFQKQYLDAFEEERDRLRDELKGLQEEEQDISDEMNQKNT